MLPFLLVAGGVALVLLAKPAATAATNLALKLVTGYVNGRPASVSLAPVGNNQMMREDAARAFLAMQAAAKAAGFDFPAVSGFRSMEQQQSLYQRWLAGTGNMAAKPGFSNHQGGVSVDIGNVGGFNTPAYRWLASNASRFGFVNDVAGEHWHWTFRTTGSRA
jgi:LAS superfamily LD-carboxypeptidase LdcB